MRQDAIVTAAMIVIGDEILSGRTKDKNIGFVADYLTGLGIDLKEVRIVADEQDDIVEAVVRAQVLAEPPRLRRLAAAFDTLEGAAQRHRRIVMGGG